MKNTQIVAERIKIQAKRKGISVKKMLETCELGVNTVTKMANGTDIVSQNLLKIAECLDCSVDYLLGRTDNPEENVIDNHNATITGGVQAIKSPVTVKAKENTDQNDIMAQFMRVFSDLSLEKKVAALEFVLQMKQSA